MQIRICLIQILLIHYKENHQNYPELLKTLITWILQDIRMTQLQSQFLIIARYENWVKS